MKFMVEGMKRRRSMRAEEEAKMGLRQDSDEGMDAEALVHDALEHGYDFSLDAMREKTGHYEGQLEVEDELENMDIDEATNDRIQESIKQEEEAQSRRSMSSRTSSRYGTTLPSAISRMEGSRSVAPSTPKLAGVRELFAEPVQDAATPRMDGIRDMYLRERAREAPATPAYEGIDDMLATPAGYHAELVPAHDGEVDGDEAQGGQNTPNGPVPVRQTRAKTSAPAATTKVPGPGRRRAPMAGTTARGKTASMDTSTMADDELTPDVPVARASKKMADAPKGAVVRRTRRAESGSQDGVRR